MNLAKTLKALGSETRLKILKLLGCRRLSSANIYKEYAKGFRDGMHRESIYRALEKLVDAEILKKEYDETEKEIVYGLRHRRLIIDLINQKICEKVSEDC